MNNFWATDFWRNPVKIITDFLINESEKGNVQGKFEGELIGHA